MTFRPTLRRAVSFLSTRVSKSLEYLIPFLKNIYLVVEVDVPHSHSAGRPRYWELAGSGIFEDGEGRSWGWFFCETGGSLRGRAKREVVGFILAGRTPRYIPMYAKENLEHRKSGFSGCNVLHVYFICSV